MLSIDKVTNLTEMSQLNSIFNLIGFYTNN